MSNLEESYYEQDSFWDPTNIRESDYKRVSDIMASIPSDVNSILDVGCGGGVFANRAKDVIKSIVAVDRSRSALKYVEVPCVLGDISHLPFKDSSFDLVTCLEVLEHIPLANYSLALSELSRISKKYIIVTVPYKENIKSKRVECPKCLCLFHMYYHLRTFNEKNLAKLFGDTCFCKSIGTSGVKQINGFGFEALKELFWFANKISIPSFVQCPLCCWRKETHSTKESDRFSIKVLIKRYWPKKKTYRWYVATYKKRGFRVGCSETRQNAKEIYY